MKQSQPSSLSAGQTWGCKACIDRLCSTFLAFFLFAFVTAWSVKSSNRQVADNTLRIGLKKAVEQTQEATRYP